MGFVTAFILPFLLESSPLKNVKKTSIVFIPEILFEASAVLNIHSFLGALLALQRVKAMNDRTEQMNLSARLFHSLVKHNGGCLSWHGTIRLRSERSNQRNGQVREYINCFRFRNKLQLYFKKIYLYN